MRRGAAAAVGAFAMAAVVEACRGGAVPSRIEETSAGRSELRSEGPAPLGPAAAPPEIGVWEARAGGPGARAGHAMAFDSGRGRTVLFGGELGATLLGDTWEWDGSSWTRACASAPCATTTPPARFATAMAYDARRGVTVLFGGQSQTGALADTWEWDGASWRNACAAGCSPAPPAVSGHAMAYDPAHGTVLFGGTSCRNGGVCALSNETWTWDGAAWTSHGSGGPSGRAGHGLAFLAGAHPAIVLFGGVNTAALADTWAWDGATWTQACAACSAPPARAYGALAFDATRGEVVLFGGTDASVDTWDWDGSGWTMLATSVAPSVRNSLAMAYDAHRQRMVLFGGEGASAEQGDTWEQYRYAGGCTANTDCETSVCAGGVCCLAACGVCETCATGTCATVTNAVDPSCDGVCDESGRCLKGEGALCASHDECASEFCADGVCCDRACTSACYACTGALTGGKDGTCLPASAGSDPHGDCPDEGACSCGADGQCDGRGACERYQPPAACACGNERRALFGYQCDGFGACTPPFPGESACDREGELAFADGGVRACAPYRCTGSPTPHCKTSCASNDDCAPPATCSADQACTAPPTTATPSTAGCSATPAPGSNGSAAAVVVLALSALGKRRRARSPRVFGRERRGGRGAGGGSRGG